MCPTVSPRGCSTPSWRSATWARSARRWSARACTGRTRRTRRPASSHSATRRIVAEQALSLRLPPRSPLDRHRAPAAGHARRARPGDRPHRGQRRDGLGTSARSARSHADTRAARRRAPHRPGARRRRHSLRRLDSDPDLGVHTDRSGRMGVPRISAKWRRQAQGPRLAIGRRLRGRPRMDRHRGRTCPRPPRAAPPAGHWRICNQPSSSTPVSHGQPTRAQDGLTAPSRTPRSSATTSTRCCGCGTATATTRRA